MVSTGGPASTVKARLSVVTLPQVSRASSTKRCGPSATIGVPGVYGAPSRVAVTPAGLASVAVQLKDDPVALQLFAAGPVTVNTGGPASSVKLRVSSLTFPQVSRAPTSRTCGPSVGIGVPDT